MHMIALLRASSVSALRTDALGEFGRVSAYGLIEHVNADHVVRNPCGLHRLPGD